MADIGSPKVRGPRKAVPKGSVVTFKTLIKHPMESGFRKDKSGQPIPAHFISKILVEYMGKQVMSADWTGAISKNPYFSFDIRAMASGPVKVTWVDNKGETFEDSAALEVQ